MSTYNTLIDAFFVFGGLYCLYFWYRIQVKQDYRNCSLIIQSDTSYQAARDKAGLLAYMCPRLLIFSALILVFGILCLANDLAHFLPTAAYWVSFIGVIAVCGWYFFCIRQAHRRFW